MILQNSFASLALGFSTGTFCAMYCAPILLPFLGGVEQNSLKKTVRLTLFFLFSRLAMYILLGTVFALSGMLVYFFNPVLARKLSIFAYMFSGLVLVFNGLPKLKKTGVVDRTDASDADRVVTDADCVGKADREASVATDADGAGNAGGVGNSHSTDDANDRDAAVAVCLGKRFSTHLSTSLQNDVLIAVLAGLSVGLHICPAFWSMLVLCAEGKNVVLAIVNFLFFFIGTLPFFLPVLGIPFVTKKRFIKHIARITQVLVGFYFIIFNGFIPLFFYTN